MLCDGRMDHENIPRRPENPWVYHPGQQRCSVMLWDKPQIVDTPGCGQMTSSQLSQHTVQVMT